LPLGKRVWGDDLIILPGDAPRKWVNVFTGEIIASETGQMPLATLLSAFPLAFLLAEA
jgi:maltooligosyltrehalose synthase